MKSAHMHSSESESRRLSITSVPQAQAPLNAPFNRTCSRVEEPLSTRTRPDPTKISLTH